MLKALADVINFHRPPDCDWEITLHEEYGYVLVHKDGKRTIMHPDDMVKMAEVTVQAATVRAIREMRHED
jgi:hypothetical protein